MRRVFFFEKKEPKNSCETALTLPGNTEAKTTKSFLLLFFKKDGPALWQTPMSPPAQDGSAQQRPRG
jgi:hypothetical protein